MQAPIPSFHLRLLKHSTTRGVPLSYGDKSTSNPHSSFVYNLCSYGHSITHRFERGVGSEEDTQSHRTGGLPGPYSADNEPTTHAWACGHGVYPIVETVLEIVCLPDVFLAEPS